jgi:hypothetical protein
MRTDKLRIENLPPIKRVETELGETTTFVGAALSDSSTQRQIHQGD